MSPKLQRIAEGRQPARTATSGRPRNGQPTPPSFKGVLIRAAIIAALYYIFLILLLKEDPGTALAISGVGLALMIPVGLLLDRARYRMQMKRWEREHPSQAARSRAESGTS